MTPRAFFTIFIKIVAIYLILESTTVLPQSFTYLYETYRMSEGITSQLMIGATVMLLVTLGIYFLIIRYCIFRTSWIIDVLKLDKDFAEEKIEFSMHRSTVLKLSVIVIGGVIFINTFPIFCKQTFLFFQQPDNFRQTPTSGWLIYYFVKSFIGYFMMTSSRLIVNFIEWKRVERNPAKKQDHTDVLDG